jgi:hypothetical protein
MRRVAVASVIAALLVVATGSSAGAVGENQNSLDFAGYQTSTASGTVLIQAQLTVPLLSCGATSSAFGALAQILNASDFYNGARLYGDCIDGSATYNAEALGVNLTGTIAPGDIMRFQVSVNPSKETKGIKATVTDVTTGATVTAIQGSMPFVPTTVQVGMIPVGVGESISDFGILHWTKVTVDRGTLDSAGAQAYNLTEHYNHPKNLVTTSALSPSGESFKNVWINTYS